MRKHKKIFDKLTKGGKKIFAKFYFLDGIIANDCVECTKKSR